MVRGLSASVGVLQVDTEPVELVEEALECEWRWWCMDRMEETDEEVDLRPRRPADDLRTEDRGV